MDQEPGHQPHTTSVVVVAANMLALLINRLRLLLLTILLATTTPSLASPLALTKRTTTTKVTHGHTLLNALLSKRQAATTTTTAQEEALNAPGTGNTSINELVLLFGAVVLAWTVIGLGVLIVRKRRQELLDARAIAHQEVINVHHEAIHCEDKEWDAMSTHSSTA